MLRELVKQTTSADENKRWFFCHEIDLVMWFSATQTPIRYQLSYDKYRQEKSVKWDAVSGLQHYAVDDGESSWGLKSSPMMGHTLTRGNPDPIIRLIRQYKGDLPPKLAQFVINTLLQRAPKNRRYRKR